MVFNKVVGRLNRDHIAGLKPHAAAFPLDIHPHPSKQALHGADVLQLRHIAQFQRFSAEQTRRKDGKRRVLGS